MKKISFILIMAIHGLLFGQKPEINPVSVPIEGKDVIVYKSSAALLIGMADYNPGWNPLPGVKKEIELMKSLMEKQGFYVETAFNLSEDQLNQKFNEFISVNCSAKDSRFLFYFSGHGRTVKTIYGDELGYLVPVDAPNPNEDLAKFLSKSIEMEVIEGFARSVGSKHSLFLFNAGFSNPIFSTTLVVPRPLTNQSLSPSHQFITVASGSDETIRTGIFAEYLSKALKGEGDKNGDKIITGTELAEYLQYNILTASSYATHVQYGEIMEASSQKGDFIFSSYVAAQSTPVTAQSTTVADQKPVREEKITIAHPPTSQPVVKKAVPAMDKVSNDFGIEMVFVEGGEFSMGTIRGHGAESPSHRVKLGDFFISSHEITQGQYREVMGINPSRFQGCDDCPVERVNYHEAMAFTVMLSKKTGNSYRLPTEAEWEYAARGGKNSKTYRFSGGNDPNLIGWFEKNAYKKSHPSGMKLANELGLYDMSGNIYEWCLDWFDEGYYRKSPVEDPRGPVSGKAKTVRGGSWKLDAGRMTSTFRYGIGPFAKYDDVGFRVVMKNER